MPTFNEIKSFFEATLWPESYTDWTLHTIVATVVFILILLLRKKTIQRKHGVIIASFRWGSILLLYYFLCIKVILWINSFESNEVGIVIAQFSGAPLIKYVGEDGIEERIKQELQLEISRNGIHSVARVHNINWKVDSEDEAREVINKYGAKGVIWGNVTQLDKNASLLYHFTLDIIAVTIGSNEIDSYPETTYEFDIARNGPHMLRFEGTTFSFENLAKQMISDFLPFILKQISGSNPQLTYELINKHPSKNPLAPFNLLIAAQALKREVREQEALKFYKLSFRMCCELLDNPLDWNDNKAEYNNLLHKLASVAKYGEGRLLAKLSDTANSIDAYIKASALDSTIAAYAAPQLKVMVGNDSVGLRTNLPTCFTRKKGTLFRIYDGK